MTPRTAARAVSVLAALALVAGCGGSDGSGSGGSRDGGGERSGASRAPDVVPTESRAPDPGRGSGDPDDINGDGHPDLLMQVPVAWPASHGGVPRIAVVFGSPRGPDPTTRTLYTTDELGVPDPSAVGNTPPYPGMTADLDDDGFADFVTRTGEEVPERERRTGAPGNRVVEYVNWGGHTGPRRGAAPTRLRLPAPDAAAGFDDVVRGDFDGDGRHDLAGLRTSDTGLRSDEEAVVLLFGPFTRTGAAARTERRILPQPPYASYSGIRADDIAPSGKPRTTGLFVHYGNDGEQSAGRYFAARPGGGLAAAGRPVREGNGYAFGDFDGDGTRDLAVGDDGGRNDEPGADSEEPDVDNSYAVYPGDGGRVRTYRPREGTGGSYTAVDHDGDGRDALLLGGREGPALYEGDRPVGHLVRRPPARVDGRRVPAGSGWLRVHFAADFDGDGKDEVVLSWTSTKLSDTYGSVPTHWWITHGVGPKDAAVFSTRKFAPPR
ncbi:FG-GAP repeat domain-containing protein [Streptomyces spectabilis]|uniref:VCBS repeat-containing protein n=1 Tax=Streptomyces spectabilis TaxID=68270 RepID=A0A516REY8_STRST|nr:VCBS repeat-containing protein [Streptomyces spectabilis]QDQ14213.1 VCBS repeat-containing protein [Streptomyces spectabilis]